MAKAILISVAVYDDQTGTILKNVIKTHNPEYYWEVEKAFEALGEQIGQFIYPHSEDADD